MLGIPNEPLDSVEASMDWSNGVTSVVAKALLRGSEGAPKRRVVDNGGSEKRSVSGRSLQRARGGIAVALRAVLASVIEDIACTCYAVNIMYAKKAL